MKRIKTLAIVVAAAMLMSTVLSGCPVPTPRGPRVIVPRPGGIPVPVPGPRRFPRPHRGPGPF